MGSLAGPILQMNPEICNSDTRWFATDSESQDSTARLVVPLGYWPLGTEIVTTTNAIIGTVLWVVAAVIAVLNIVWILRSSVRRR